MALSELENAPNVSDYLETMKAMVEQLMQNPAGSPDEINHFVEKVCGAAAEAILPEETASAPESQSEVAS